MNLQNSVSERYKFYGIVFKSDRDFTLPVWLYSNNIEVRINNLELSSV